VLRRETRQRARALQLLYALEVTGESDTTAAAEAIAKLTGDHALIFEDVEPMVVRIRAEREDLDRLAEVAADNWRIERIAMIERNILRIAIHEMVHERIPPRVAIDEALWLAHRFAGVRAPAFINGILDRVARDLGRL
jgi:N utilization substance protein B